ncbi:MAG: GH25 family lysozyme [Anaerolineaceae bacterium]
MSYFVCNQEYAFGIDLSVYNAGVNGSQYPDFDQIAAHVPQVGFMALRTGQSWGYKDEAFPIYLREALRIGVCLLPYHVIYPGEPALRQMDALLNILEGVNLDTVRLVLDMELEHDQSRAVITNTLLSCIEFLMSETGRLPIIYSRALWLNEHVHVNDLPPVDWWLAQYHFRRAYPDYTPEYPCPPLLPGGVSRWLIHQTAERGPAIGGAGRYMDYNRWNGTRANLLAYFGKKSDIPATVCPLNGLICTGRPNQIFNDALTNPSLADVAGRCEPTTQPEISQSFQTTPVPTEQIHETKK